MRPHETSQLNQVYRQVSIDEYTQQYSEVHIVSFCGVHNWRNGTLVSLQVLLVGS